VTCQHLRQWLPNGDPGASVKLPCADPRCPDGSPGEKLVQPAFAQVARYLTEYKPLTFTRSRVWERYNGQPYRWRWVPA